MHPVFHRILSKGSTRLCNFAFMVREHQVHTATMDIKFIAQIFCSHGRTFHMPTGETFTPRSFPAHNMFRRCFLPQCKIDTAAFLTLSVEVTCRFEHILYIPSGKFSVMMFFVVFLHIKINRPFTYIGISCIKDFLSKFNLFHNMSGGMRFNAWRQHIKGLHRFMVAIGIILHHFHWLQLIQPCFFGYFILSRIGIIFQMPHIGNIPYITDFIPQMHEVPEQNIKGNGRTGMS